MLNEATSKGLDGVVLRKLGSYYFENNSYLVAKVM